jgi:broad specificity phosphatase PhoE
MPAVDPETDPAMLVASPEPRAWQTLSMTGNGLRRDRRLQEVNRIEPFDDDFRGRRRRYVTGEDLPGWEPQLEVAGRFAAAVREAQRLAGGQPVVLATHGMALTVWLAHAVGLADPGAFWADLRFPDLLAVDQAGRTVVRVPGAAGTGIRT